MSGYFEALAEIYISLTHTWPRCWRYNMRIKSIWELRCDRCWFRPEFQLQFSADAAHCGLVLLVMVWLPSCVIWIFIIPVKTSTSWLVTATVISLYGFWYDLTCCIAWELLAENFMQFLIQVSWPALAVKSIQLLMYSVCKENWNYNFCWSVTPNNIVHISASPNYFPRNVSIVTHHFYLLSEEHVHKTGIHM